MTEQKTRPFRVFASLYDKTVLDVFLHELLTIKPDTEIIASGGTATQLAKWGFTVTSVEKLTGQRPILDGCVKTLVPQLYGGVLALEDNPTHDADRAEYKIPIIDMSIHDFYPLETEIAKPGSTEESVRKETDVGGPTFAHASAKGRKIVLVRRSQWKEALERLRAGTDNDPAYRRHLAGVAEREVAKYIMTSAEYLSGGNYTAIFGERIRELKYGENPGQKPAFQYAIDSSDPLALHNFRLAEGNPSHTTMTDLDRSLQTLTHISAVLAHNGHPVGDITVGVKHGNPCGEAQTGGDTLLALRKMLHGNLTAIFGGAIITNFPITKAEADVLLHYESAKRRPIDLIAAPEFSDEAVEELHRKEGKCKLFANPALRTATLDTSRRFRHVRGGFLTQPNYTFVPDLRAQYVTKHGLASDEQEMDMLLAWAIGSTSNSNKITLVKSRQLIGNGVSQQSRVEAAELALLKVRYSGDMPRGAVAYSDSYFPFPDGPQLLIDAGVSAILTSSGSVRDSETIALCKERNVPLYMIPDEMCRGFYAH